MEKWGHPGDEEGMENVTLVPKLQPPDRWKVWGGRFSARYLEGYCFLGIFHILIWGWLSSEGQGSLRL